MINIDRMDGFIEGMQKLSGHANSVVQSAKHIAEIWPQIAAELRAGRAVVKALNRVAEGIETGDDQLLMAEVWAELGNYDRAVKGES